MLLNVQLHVLLWFVNVSEPWSLWSARPGPTLCFLKPPDSPLSWELGLVPTGRMPFSGIRQRLPALWPHLLPREECLWLAVLTGPGDYSCHPPPGCFLEAAGGERLPEDTREHGSQTHIRQTRGPASSVQLSNWGISFQACALIQRNLLGLRKVLLTRASTCWRVPLDQGYERAL